MPTNFAFLNNKFLFPRTIYAIWNFGTDTNFWDTCTYDERQNNNVNKQTDKNNEKWAV